MVEHEGDESMPTISPFVGTISCRECGNEERGGRLMDIDVVVVYFLQKVDWVVWR